MKDNWEYGIPPKIEPWGLSDPLAIAGQAGLNGILKPGILPEPMSPSLPNPIEPPLPLAEPQQQISPILSGPSEPSSILAQPLTPETLPPIISANDGLLLAEPPLSIDAVSASNKINELSPIDHMDATPEIVQSDTHNPAYYQPSEEKHDIEGTSSSRMWSDRDYPFFPKPRGGKLKGTRQIRMRKRVSMKYPIVQPQEKCPVCKSPIVLGRCLSCTSLDTCPDCGHMLFEGKCINQDCEKSREKCPECGEELPCNCGYER